MFNFLHCFYKNYILFTKLIDLVILILSTNEQPFFKVPKKVVKENFTTKQSEKSNPLALTTLFCSLRIVLSNWYKLSTTK